MGKRISKKIASVVVLSKEHKKTQPTLFMKAINKIKLLPYAMDYWKRYFFSVINYHPCDVLIDMACLKLSRRMSQITAQLYNSGYRPCLKLSFDDYVHRKMTDEEYSHVPLRIACVYTFRNRRDPFAFAVCHPREKEKYKKALILNQNMQKFKEHLNDKFFFPILMHPEYMVENEADGYVWSPNDNNRRIGILFIGNTELSYNKFATQIHEKYGLYARREVIEHVVERFPEHIIRPESEVELLGMLDTENLLDKIVIIDRFRVKENYFSLYKMARLHLWTPGFSMPYCHNTIESLACGVIPFYQCYPYYPGMLEGYNCLSYRSFDEMDNIIRRFLEGGIPSHELDLMGEHARELYDTYFSKKAIKQKIDSFVADDTTPYEEFYICWGAFY